MPRIRSRYRNLNARGKGVEAYRLIAYDGRAEWADRHPSAIVTADTWTGRGMLASQRKCWTKVEIPPGLIVIEIEKAVGYSGGREPATYAAGVVTEDQERPIAWGGIDGYSVRHVGVKKTPNGYAHILEINGERKQFLS